MQIRNFLSCAALFIFNPVFSGEDYSQFLAHCTFKGSALEDIEYILVNNFNNKAMMQYNSTRGNWTGYTPYSTERVNYLNKNPFEMLQRDFEKKVLCTDNKHFIQQYGTATAVPTIKLNSINQPSVLVCSAYNFYPKQIRMTWLRNGQEVTSPVSSSEVLSDGEWYYQIHSYLEYTPAAGEKITCMVEHQSLSEPVLLVWDPSLPAPERIKIVLGLCGLILGLLTVSSGFIYYKRKSAAYFTVHQGQVSIPVEHFPAAGAT